MRQARHVKPRVASYETSTPWKTAAHTRPYFTAKQPHVKTTPHMHKGGNTRGHAKDQRREMTKVFFPNRLSYLDQLCLCALDALLYVFPLALVLLLHKLGRVRLDGVPLLHNLVQSLDGCVDGTKPPPGNGQLRGGEV